MPGDCPNPTVLVGWLHRSHKGDAARLERRYFVSNGFAVEYRRTPDPTTRTGQFDLRNVTSLDQPAPSRLAFHIKDKPRTLDVFLEAAEDAAAWRALWASAVDEKALSLALEASRDAALVDRFHELRAEQRQTRALRKEVTVLATPKPIAGATGQEAPPTAADPPRNQPQDSAGRPQGSSSRSGSPRHTAEEDEDGEEENVRPTPSFKQ